MAIRKPGVTHVAPGSVWFALFLALASWLACLGDSCAAPLVLAPIPAPKLPAATQAPDIGDSYVRMTVSASLAPVRAGVERALVKELASGSDEELAPMSDEGSDALEGRRVEGDVRYRAHIWREAVTWTPARDSLVVRIPIAYSVTARGAGFSPISCGSESEPERAEIGCLTRLGWRDDWGVEALSSPLPTLYRRRCKPTPPGVDFTALVDQQVQARAGTSLPGLVDSLIGDWRGGRTVIETGWKALVEPLKLSLQGIDLDWDPQEARAAPLTAAGDSIVFDVSFRVRPRMVLATAVLNVPPRNRPLPEPRVRVAKDEVRIPFDFEIPTDTLAGQVRSACDQEGESVRVPAARVTAGGDRVLVSLTLAGDFVGTVHFLGQLRYDPVTFRLEVPDLAPSPETDKVLRSLGAKRALPIRNLGRRALAALRIELRDDITMWASSLGKVMQRPIGEDLYLQGGVNRRELAGVYGNPDAIGVRLIAEGRAHLVRNY